MLTIQTPSLPCPSAVAPCACGGLWGRQVTLRPQPSRSASGRSCVLPVRAEALAFPGVTGATTRQRAYLPSRATTALSLLPRPVGPGLGRADQGGVCTGRVPASGASPLWAGGANRLGAPHAVPLGQTVPGSCPAGREIGLACSRQV